MNRREEYILLKEPVEKAIQNIQNKQEEFRCSSYVERAALLKTICPYLLDSVVNTLIEASTDLQMLHELHKEIEDHYMNGDNAKEILKPVYYFLKGF